MIKVSDRNFSRNDTIQSIFTSSAMLQTAKEKQKRQQEARFAAVMARHQERIQVNWAAAV
jgi:hypothetical protein